MTISYIGEGSQAHGGGEVTCTTPGSAAAGDMLVFFGGTDSTSSWDNPPDLNTTNDFTTLSTGNAGSTHSWCMAYYEISGTPASSYVFNFSGSVACCGIMMCFRTTGSWVTPVLTTTASINDGKSTDAETTTLTANSGDWVACYFTNDGDQTHNVDPTGMTQVVDHSTGSFNGVGYYESGLSAGAFTKTQTYNASDDWAAMCVILRETGAASAFPYHSIKQQRKDIKTLLTM